MKDHMKGKLKMIIDKLNIKDNLEEIMSHSLEPFPHSSNYAEMKKFPGGFVPWHWHKDIEMTIVLKGNLRLTTSMGEYHLTEGEAMFINSNILHLQVPEKNSDVIILSQVFDVGLISGQYGSIYAQKYVEPLLSCKEIDIMIFHASDVRHRKIIEAIRMAQDASDEKAFGYEIIVRNYLSYAWLLIVQEAEQKLNEKRVSKKAGDDRLKEMMLFIQSHYMEKISLTDIAYAANISNREALRAFSNVLHTTPFTYLIDYRIRMATTRLKETDEQITEISYNCGFSSPSYFGKIFHEKMNCTALEYRKKYRELF